MKVLGGYRYRTGTGHILFMRFKLMCLFYVSGTNMIYCSSELHRTETQGTSKLRELSLNNC